MIASTNRPFDLDEAVLRRLPRRILVNLPDFSTRLSILQVTLSGNRLDNSVNLTMLAEKLDGYTGSDIKEVCREAVVRVSHESAARQEKGDIKAYFGAPEAREGGLTIGKLSAAEVNSMYTLSLFTAVLTSPLLVSVNL